MYHFRTLCVSSLFALAVALTVSADRLEPRPAATEDGISVYFSPGGGIEAAIIDAVDGAEQSVDVLAYFFTSPPIAKAVTKAHERGVKVRVIVDHASSSRGYTAATLLHNAGVPVYSDREHKTAHNKVMLIDGTTVITGSFNFTRSAETSNSENLLVIDDKPGLSAAYADEFDRHLAHAKPFVPPRPSEQDKN